jgi:hypothetical protein
MSGGNLRAGAVERNHLLSETPYCYSLRYYFTKKVNEELRISHGL